MTKDEIIKALRDMAKYPTVTLPRDCEALRMAADLLAQPEQEPVAWMDDYNACKCPDNEARCFSDKVFRMMQKHTDSLVKRQEPVAKVCHDLDGHIGWNPNLKQLPNEGTPLYTTPPQRKPLTDEEIILIVAECASSYQHTDIHFARAIERAHGIKELV
jgi:hypothetical protein